LITDLLNLYSIAIMLSEETEATTRAMYQFPDGPTRWISPALRHPAVKAFRPHPGDKRVPDLYSQFEALLDAVWQAEANWRFDDRLDQALKVAR
jgi:hypothetical protein